MHPDAGGDLQVRSTLRILAVLVALASSACTLETTGAVKGDDRYLSRFDDAQELVVGHTVRISDINVGTVMDIELDGYEALVEFTLENGRTLPEGTTATVAVTSLLGENYLLLELPEDPENQPVLPPGSEVPSAGSAATVEELAVELLSITRAIRGRDLAAIVDAGAVGLGPRGDALHELIGTLGSVTENFAAQSEVFDSLLTDLDGLLSSLADDAADIGQTLELAADATGSLARQRERLVSVVEDLTRLAVTLDAEVLAPHRARLTRIVADLVPVVSVLTDDRAQLIRTVDQLVTVTERFPTAIHEGGVIAYAWLDDFNIDGLQFQTTEFGTALRNLLLGAPS